MWTSIFGKVGSILIFSIGIMGITGCSLTIGTTKTPAPQPTPQSSPVKGPISNPQDAVNVALGYANLFRVHLIGDVQTVSVQKLSQSKANELYPSANKFQYPGHPEMQVWLVVFNSQTSVSPPPAAGTPYKTGFVCTYVIVPVDHSGASADEGDCPSK